MTPFTAGFGIPLLSRERQYGGRGTTVPLSSGVKLLIVRPSLSLVYFTGSFIESSSLGESVYL